MAKLNRKKYRRAGLKGSMLMALHTIPTYSTHLPMPLANTAGKPLSDDDGQ